MSAPVNAFRAVMARKYVLMRGTATTESYPYLRGPWNYTNRVEDARKFDSHHDIFKFIAEEYGAALRLARAGDILRIVEVNCVVTKTVVEEWVVVGGDR